MKFLLLHLLFIVCIVTFYFIEPYYIFILMEKGMLFIPNMMLVLIQVLSPSNGSKISVKNRNANLTYYNEDSESYNMLAMASRGESFDEIERPGTKVAIGLTKPKKPRIKPYSNLNKNITV